MAIAPLHLMAVTGALRIWPADPSTPSYGGGGFRLRSSPSEEAIAAAGASIASVVEVVFTAVWEGDLPRWRLPDSFIRRQTDQG